MTNARSTKDSALCKQRRILISGASIAGTCLAFWLQRYGMTPVVLEKAASFRDGGQNIDIKGVAEEVLELMGLGDAVRQRNTLEQGLKFVSTHGNVAGTFRKGIATSFTRDIEILRGELARVFYNATKDKVSYRFGTAIEDIQQNQELVTVRLNDGSSENFDLVISAEGIGSSTRRLVMGDQIEFKFLKVHTCYFRIPRLPSDDNWAYWMTAPRG